MAAVVLRGDAGQKFSFTRDQLINALTRIQVRPVAGKVVAEWMADALIEVLSEEEG